MDSDHSRAAHSLWLVCGCMALGAYLPGLLALNLPLHGHSHSLTSTISAGLLLGAGLCVIVPEGFNSLLTAQEAVATGQKLPAWSTGAALLLGFIMMASLDIWNPTHVDTDHKCAGHFHELPPNISQGQRHACHEHRIDVRHGQQQQQQQQGLATQATSGSQEHDTRQNLVGHVQAWEHPRVNPTDTDTLAGCRIPGTTRHPHTHSISLSEPTEPSETTSLLHPEDKDLVQGPKLSNGVCSAATAIDVDLPQEHHHMPAQTCEIGISSTSHHSPLQRHHTLGSAQATLFGLVFHSAADGLAVGAAGLSGNLIVSLTIALSIMVHKVPVAYGLAAFLKAAGMSFAQAHTGLLYFAAAAPLAALITFYVLSSISWVSNPQVVALVLLCSGGTVLYAGAVHVYPSAGKRFRDLVLLTLAALLPLLINATLAHE